MDIVVIADSILLNVCSVLNVFLLMMNYVKNVWILIVFVLNVIIQQKIRYLLNMNGVVKSAINYDLRVQEFRVLNVKQKNIHLICMDADYDQICMNVLSVMKLI